MQKNQTEIDRLTEQLVQIAHTVEMYTRRSQPVPFETLQIIQQWAGEADRARLARDGII
jgi:hypothetical protein